MTVIAKLAAELAYRSGINHRDLMPIAAAVIVAVHKGVAADDPQEAFPALAALLPTRPQTDALARVKDWLEEPELSADQAAMLSALWPEAIGSQLNWTEELDALIEHARYRDPFIAMSTTVAGALIEAMKIPAGQSVGCLFAGCASIAWELARSRPVTLHLSNWEAEVVLALLAFADERQLTVDRRNPIEWCGMTGGNHRFTDADSPRAGEYDHIITVPPLGLKLQNGDHAGMSFEGWQVAMLASRANESFRTIVTDGLLFRESRSEVELRKQLVTEKALSVTSLPPGIFGRASGVAVNLLEIRSGPCGTVCVQDGRPMERVSRNIREQETLIAKQIRNLGETRRAEIAVSDLAALNYNLLPSRYVLDDRLAAYERQLTERRTVRLGDVATVIRPRASQPVRENPAEDDILAMEASVSDIVDGRLASVSKEVRYRATEAPSVDKATLMPDDIVISIKGNVGRVGIATADALLGSIQKMPWVISQSLAVIRLKASKNAPSPRILAAILASGPMTEMLQRLATGTTVKALPIGSLLDLAVPLPEADEQAEMIAQLNKLDAMQAEIDEQTEKRREMHAALWREFWDILPDSPSF